MLKVMTIVGTRPEIIKLSRVMAELDKYTEHIIVHTGQNYDYELNEIFFQELRIRKPDYFLDAAGKNAAETIANVIRKSDELMEEVKPDAVLLYGDTNSCISVISAKRKKFRSSTWKLEIVALTKEFQKRLIENSRPSERHQYASI